MKEDIAVQRDLRMTRTSSGSALRVFISSERLTYHLRINEIGEVGKIEEEDWDESSEFF